LRLFRKCAVELQQCLFDYIVEKQTKVGILFGFRQKSLKNVIDVTHTLFLSSEKKELSKPTKFRIKFNISPLTPASVLP